MGAVCGCLRDEMIQSAKEHAIQVETNGNKKQAEAASKK
jgi:hypothetical protein